METVTFKGVDLEVEYYINKGCKSNSTLTPPESDDMEIISVNIGGQDMAPLIDACDLWDELEETVYKYEDQK